jgi:ABC-type multidrug transport system ATPase subunit
MRKTNSRTQAVVVEGFSKSFLEVRGVPEVMLSIGPIAKAASKLPFLRRFLSRNEVLRDVSFAVPQGSIFGIFGINGSGKTTLLQCICNLLSAELGRVYIHGKEVQSFGAKLGQILAKCNRRELHGVFTAIENVEFVARLYGIDQEEAKNAARELLGTLGVSDVDRERQLFQRLSLGNKGKVALVCSLIPLLRKRSDEEYPPILVLDEPTFGFDVVSVERFFSAIRSLQQHIPSLTVIIASNDPREAALCDDYVALVDGHAECDEAKLQHLKRSMSQSRRALSDFADVIGEELTNGDTRREKSEVPTCISAARRYSPLSAFAWRMFLDGKRNPFVIANMVITIVLPLLLGHFASAGSRGVWPALAMTMFAVYLSLNIRDGSSLYDREKNRFNTLELLLISPVSRVQHIVSMTILGMLMSTIYALLSFSVLGLLSYGSVVSGLQKTVATLSPEAYFGIALVLIGSTLAARTLGLMIALVPYVTRPGQAFIFTMTLPTMAVVCGGIFSSLDTLPPGFVHFAHLNPITYGSASLIEFMNFDFGGTLAVTDWLVERIPRLRRVWANVLILGTLSSAYLAMTALFVGRLEKLLRRIGRLRRGAH